MFRSSKSKSGLTNRPVVVHEGLVDKRLVLQKTASKKYSLKKRPAHTYCNSKFSPDIV